MGSIRTRLAWSQSGGITSGWTLTLFFLSAGAAVALRPGQSRQTRATPPRPGHSAAVLALAFSPDGQLLASGGADDDPTVRLWDVKAGHELRVLRGHAAAVVSLAFSPDGRWLASASHDGTVKIWKVTTGRAVRTVTAQPDWISSARFSPDGHWLASASGGKFAQAVGRSSDWEIRLWDTRTWRQTRALRGHNNGVLSVAFSPNSRLLASVGEDNTLRIWDVAAGREQHQITIHKPCWHTPVFFTPDGSKLGLGAEDFTVTIWDVATGRAVERLENPSRVCVVAISPDGRSLAAAGFYVSSPFQVVIWDLSTRSVLQRLTEHQETVDALTFSPDGQLLASGSSDTSVILWDTLTWKPVRILGHPRRYQTIE